MKEALTALRPRRIFLRAPNWVGDVVMATPAFYAIRERFPDAHITLGIRSYARELVDGSSAIDAVVSPGPQRGLRAALRFGRSLRAESFDLAVLFTNSFSTAVEARAASIPRRLGYAGDGRSWLLSDRLPKALRFEESGRMRSMLASYGQLAEALGAEISDPSYRLEPTAKHEAEADAWCAGQGLSKGELLFGLNPGAKGGSSKLWPAEYFAAVADGLVARHGGRCVLLGGPGEEELLAKIETFAENPLINSGRDILGLGALAAFLPRLSLLVTNDTGPRAMGQAMGVPEVVICGPYDEGLTAANNERAVVLGRDLPCRPCNRPVCPLEHHECMRGLGPERVLEAAEGLFEKFRNH